VAQLQFAQKAVVTDGDKILLVRKSNADPNNPGKWELPGGRLQGSEDLDEHVVREVLEETGFTVLPGPPVDLWSWEMRWDGEQVRVIAFSRRCTLKSRSAVGHQRQPDDYLCEQRWFRYADLPTIDIIPSQVPTIRQVAHLP
jgi:8-oxo-dGTP pyrophosphatase MutT (NUDIX family)